MGYEYELRGWFKADTAVNLDDLDASAGEDPSLWFRVTGRQRNYVTFGTGSKWRNNQYLSWLRQLAERHKGTGLATITGEWLYDGKDRFTWLHDGQSRTLPLLNLYHPDSNWHALYRAAHYMDRSLNDFVLPDSHPVAELIGNLRSIKGWLQLEGAPDLNELTLELRRQGDLAESFDSLEQLGRPYLLFGDKVQDPSVVLQTLARVTERFPGTYGLLYFSSPDEREQQPIALEAGRVKTLPCLKTGDFEAFTLATRTDVRFERHGNAPANATYVLEGSMPFDGLAAAIRQLTSSQSLVGHDNGRFTTEDSVSYLFRNPTLTFYLTEQSATSNALLQTWMEADAAPAAFEVLLGELARLLSSVGISVRRQDR